LAALLTLFLTACLGPSDAEERFAEGVALLEEGRFEEDIDAFDSAIFLDGSMAPAFYNRALAEQQTGSLVSAIKNFTRAIDLSPDLAPAYAKAYQVRAAAYSELGDQQLSQADIDKAVALGVDRTLAEAGVKEASTTP